MTMKVGFVGLGDMGLPMARNLCRSGFQVFAYDIRQEPLDMLQAAGAIPCSSARQAAAEAEVVVTMLPHGEAVRSAVLGEGGIVAGLGAGDILVEMSTVSISTMMEVHRSLSAQGVAVLDAPVSGTPDIAARGQLTILVGGEESAVERCRPALAAMGSAIIPMGAVGSGKLAKMVNNMLVTVNLLGVMEVLAWAKKAGADLERLGEALRHTMASSRMLEYHLSRLDTTNQDYADQHIWLHKDLRLLQEEAEATWSALPLTAQAKQIVNAARNLAAGAETMGSLMAYYEQTV